MKNIFENAYFGKAYKTRDGRKAIFVNWSDTRKKVYLYVLERDMEFFGEEMYELDGVTSGVSTPHDIISEWEELVEEDKYDKIAQEVKNDVINKACEWWSKEMKSSCLDEVYEKWRVEKLEEFKKAMEE